MNADDPERPTGWARDARIVWIPIALALTHETKPLLSVEAVHALCAATLDQVAPALVADGRTRGILLAPLVTRALLVAYHHRYPARRAGPYAVPYLRQTALALASGDRALLR